MAAKAKVLRSLCLPTTKEENVQTFHKDQIRKPNKFKVLPLAFKVPERHSQDKRAGIAALGQSSVTVNISGLSRTPPNPEMGAT